jgi:uncharacterized protein (DUF4415 family)
MSDTTKLKHSDPADAFRRRLIERAQADIDSMTDEEDARLTAAAEADPDNPPLTEDVLRNARPATETHPHIVARYRGQRGPGKVPAKVLVSLRIDPDVIDHFRATGDGWQARINAELRKASGL